MDDLLLLLFRLPDLKVLRQYSIHFHLLFSDEILCQILHFTLVPDPLSAAVIHRNAPDILIDRNRSLRPIVLLLKPIFATNPYLDDLFVWRDKNYSVDRINRSQVGL